MWAVRDSNPRSPKTSDLQSDAIAAMRTAPGASEGNRPGIHPGGRVYTLPNPLSLTQSPRTDLNRRPTVYKTVALPLSYVGIN